MPAWCLRVVPCLVLACLSSTALASPGLSIGPITAAGGGALARQLDAALCGAGCEAWAKVSTRGVLDPRKAAALDVKGVLTGSVAKKGAARVLSLSFFTGKPKAARSWTFPLDGAGLLGPGALRQLQADLRLLVGAPPPAARPPLSTEPSRQAPPAAALVPRPAPAPAPVTAPVPPTAPPDRTAPPAPARPAARPVVAAELGLLVTGRSLTYRGASPGSATLLAFDVATIASPGVRLEVFPAARSVEGPLQGLGVFVDYSRSLGVDTKAIGGAVATETTFSRLAAGLLWRTPPLSSWRVTLVPTLSYQRHGASSSPTLAGLPDAELSGLGLALGAEAPLGDRLQVLAGLGYVSWSTAKDLVAGDPAFFPGGTASAFDVEAGVAVALGRRLSLRALLQARLIGYSLDPDPSGTYLADGAGDAYLGGRLVLRGEY